MTNKELVCPEDCKKLKKLYRHKLEFMGYCCTKYKMDLDHVMSFNPIKCFPCRNQGRK